MKKYKTTKKHPELKTGVEFFKRYPEDEEYMSESDTLIMLTDDIEICLENGWIKEIEEKEFTKSDMIEFASYRIRTSLGNTTSYNEFFEQWLKQRNEKV